MTPYESSVRSRDGFAQTLRSEWTKFRTVRGWVIGAAVAPLIMVLLGLLTAAASRSTYDHGPGTPAIVGHPDVPLGPAGEAVSDTFSFAHQSLAGDGTVTARLTSLRGSSLSPEGELRSDQLQPWAKAGLIIKADTAQGSTYAAVVVTGDHGVRLQYDFTGDIAGPATAAPQWLRLTRAGDTITASASPDGQTWTTVGTVRLTGLPATAQVGLFATSPHRETTTAHLGGGGKVVGGPALATATFDEITRQGQWGADGWTPDLVGAGDDTRIPGIRTVEQVGDTVTVAGSGDIAPLVVGAGTAIERVLAGAFGALTVVAIVAVLFMTTEYRRGLIRTTLAATPRRGRVLAAKVIVLGTVTFVTGLAGAAATVWLSVPLLRSNGNFIFPIAWWTELRVIAGMAAVLAVTAVLALAVGAIVRRSAGAVAAIIVLVVLPYILATAAVLPAEPSQWLLRITPAAAFALQQSLPAYPQVAVAYTPAFGFFPLSPWAGFAVLCGYAVLALAGAGYLLRRRDV